MELKEMKQEMSGIIAEQLSEFQKEHEFVEWGDKLESKLQDLIDEHTKGTVSEDTFKEKLDNLNGEMQKFQKDFDEYQTEVNGKMKNQQPITKDFDTRLEDTLKSEDAFKRFKERESRQVAVTLKDLGIHDVKTSNSDMTQGSNFTNDVVEPTRVPGIIFDPDRMSRIRNFLSTARTTSNAIFYNQETSYDDSTAMVAEGAQYPQSDFAITQQSESVKKIGTHVTLSEEMLEDLPALAGYIRARLLSKLKLKEDTQILYGSGSGQNLTGITGVASSYSDILADSDVNRFDVLAMAVRQGIVAEYAPNIILIHPTDYFRTILEKDSQGNYVFPDAVRLGTSVLTVAGVPMTWNTAVTAGDFITGDFRSGAQLFDRRDAVIEFGYENNDNFEKGMVTVRISERVVLAVYRTNAFIYGDFATALAEGSA